MNPETEAAVTELRRSVVTSYASGAVLVHDLLIDDVLTEIARLFASGDLDGYPALLELADRINATGRQ
jgi:hypothetical protein